MAGAEANQISQEIRDVELSKNRLAIDETITETPAIRAVANFSGAAEAWIARST